MATLEANGINGASLLGFLAAVGSLRLLAEKHPSARLWFDRDSDRARVCANDLSCDDAIANVIIGRYFSAARCDELTVLGAAEMPNSIYNDEVDRRAEEDRIRKSKESKKRTEKLKAIATAKVLSEMSTRALSQPSSPMWAAVPGWVCDGLAKKEKNYLVAETALCAANGAGHQMMFQTLRDLRNLEFADGRMQCPLPPLLTQEHLRSALRDVWKFGDTVSAEAVSNDGWMGNRKPTLRWDESAERLHALRLHEPTADPAAFATQLGAYALAASALPCFPTFPVRGGGMTAFTRRGRDAGELIFYWPLWDVPMSLAAFLATHASGEALRKAADARLRGVYRLMSVRRMTQDKGKLTFQSPEAVW